jgi:predicted phosphodiesterase
MASFHVLSDLHLELFPGFRLDAEAVTAPYVILAGDIADPRTGEYRSFLEHCSRMFDAVFVVLGNHEAYGSSLAAAAAAAQAVCDAFPNVHLLQRGAVDVGADVRIAGTTLWSHVPRDRAFNTACYVGDYRRIDGFTVDVNNALHAADVRWIEGEILRARADGKRLVVATHHAPLVRGTSHPMHSGSPLNCAFATDLSRIIADPVSLWVHGHTHHSHSTTVGACRVVANQRGYADDASEGEGFDPYLRYSV